MSAIRFLKCLCGATWPHVGTTKSRLKSADGPYAVGCTCCGRVGQHGMTEKQANEKR